MGSSKRLIDRRDIDNILPHILSKEEDALNYVLNVVNNLRYGTKPEDVASFFSSNAVLFATLSGIFNDTNQKILEYFKEFLTIKGLKSGEPIERTV